MHTKYQKKKLKNGATLVAMPQEHTSSVTIFVGFPVGSRFEDARINGTSHFIEHMMFKGTERRPHTKDITTEIDAAGAQWNAFTSKEWTVYYIKIDSSRLEDAADLIEDMLFHSKFENDEFQREKGVINEELRMYEDTPARDVQEEFELIMHEGSPLSYKIGGTPEIINALTRDDLVNYRDKFYHHDKMVVGVSGHYSEDQLAKVETIFEKGEKKGGTPEMLTSQAADAKDIVRLKYKKTDQVHIALGFPAFKRGDDRLPALSLLQVIMGGSMSSRLFIEIRERRGLAYRVRTDIEVYHDTGNTYVHAGLHTERIDQALEVLVAELKKVAANGVTEQELEHAKGNVRGSMILALEDSATVAQFFVEQELLAPETFTPEQKLAKIDAVTLSDIQEVAKEVFDFTKAKLAVIGPFDDPKRFEKFLN